ncbi:hypothetical protein AJ79_09123 [Helicocarpus griseus UAMH5409]|uniref:Uncharacterized protein n=1 Tax=Helicocarpus griseus UAMH5409 TaxID=1447875 RepID=A0A2B7WLY0_9EURO|nr:hypothetical protein AJ79_09123 [Helicocarpus griseus UAMH5409]
MTTSQSSKEPDEASGHAEDRSCQNDPGSPNKQPPLKLSDKSSSAEDPSATQTHGEDMADNEDSQQSVNRSPQRVANARSITEPEDGNGRNPSLAGRNITIPGPRLHLRGGGCVMSCLMPEGRLEDHERPPQVTWWLAGGRTRRRGAPTMGHLRQRRQRTRGGWDRPGYEPSETGRPFFKEMSFVLSNARYYGPVQAPVQAMELQNQGAPAPPANLVPASATVPVDNINNRPQGLPHAAHEQPVNAPPAGLVPAAAPANAFNRVHNAPQQPANNGPGELLPDGMVPAAVPANGLNNTQHPH